MEVLCTGTGRSHARPGMAPRSAPAIREEHCGDVRVARRPPRNARRVIAKRIVAQKPPNLGQRPAKAALKIRDDAARGPAARGDQEGSSGDAGRYSTVASG
jgi:hypothetical protein